MRTVVLARMLSVVVLSLVSVSAGAQQQPAAAPAAAAPPVAPAPEQLEPAVNTSAPASQPQAAAAPASAAPAAAAPPKGAGAAPAPKGAARGAKGADRVELETTDITGNRELPKVLYIVPWKRSDLGDLVGRPPNSLLDEVLQPIDREVFLRENRYYDALKPDAAGSRTGTVPGSGDKP
jgi:hypothetical protein